MHVRLDTYASREGIRRIEVIILDDETLDEIAAFDMDRAALSDELFVTLRKAFQSMALAAENKVLKLATERISDLRTDV